MAGDRALGSAGPEASLREVTDAAVAPETRGAANTPVEAGATAASGGER